MTKKKESVYRVEATCYVCGKAYKARYNIADRAKTCTSSLQPDHVCRRKTVKIPGRRDKLITCIDGCCRSRYMKGATTAATNSAIDTRKFLSSDEYRKVVTATKKLDDPKGISLRFILETGCRCGEALLFRKEYVEWKDGPLSNLRMPTLKKQGHPLLSIHLDNNGDFAREFRTWIKKFASSDLLFQVAKRTLQRTFEQILDKIKPERVGLVHLLRHTRASRLIAAGFDFNYVRSQLRWSSIELAKIYVHTEEKKIVDGFERMSKS